ncbi:Serine/threonine protein kinase [Fimbriiglobus ruber]|uniref:Serine/threonine protein kinase n=2 Tax=Fimbriiglobus ruber TaxID=1908690 RepID=A0A225E654_9BACT|nr:Serine/threonine protein kinase [Fimbriiglobus ruber]
MSEVFFGYDPEGFRGVAVKLLADHLASQKLFVNRFYREAKMSRLLVHPNIVRGESHGHDGASGKHFLILEYIDGPNALALVDRCGPLPVGSAVRIGIEVARALQYLHDLKFVHRDVKPENILVGPDGSAKLADFGLAKLIEDDANLTSVNTGVGTPHYMPYEQAVNGELVDGRSDLFALGATLYHLLTGVVPFRGQTHEEIVREKAHDVYSPSRDFRPEIPPVLDQILARTLALDPRARYQTAAQFVEALEATDLATDGPINAAQNSSATTTPTDPQSVARTRADLGVVPPDSAADPVHESSAAPEPIVPPLSLTVRARSLLLVGLLVGCLVGLAIPGFRMATRSIIPDSVPVPALVPARVFPDSANVPGLPAARTSQ